MPHYPLVPTITPAVTQLEDRMDKVMKAIETFSQILQNQNQSSNDNTNNNTIHDQTILTNITNVRVNNPHQDPNYLLRQVPIYQCNITAAVREGANFIDETMFSNCKKLHDAGLLLADTILVNSLIKKHDRIFNFVYGAHNLLHIPFDTQHEFDK